VTTTLSFNFPVGAIILVRYGSNISWLGWDTQKQTLDGSAVWKRLSVGGWSRFGATVKIKPLQDSEVTYEQWPGDIVQRIPAAH
jgi:hypothetical protein